MRTFTPSKADILGCLLMAFLEIELESTLKIIGIDTEELVSFICRLDYE